MFEYLGQDKDGLHRIRNPENDVTVSMSDDGVSGLERDGLIKRQDVGMVKRTSDLASDLRREYSGVQQLDAPLGGFGASEPIAQNFSMSQAEGFDGIPASMEDIESGDPAFRSRTTDFAQQNAAVNGVQAPPPPVVTTGRQVGMGGSSPGSLPQRGQGAPGLQYNPDIEYQAWLESQARTPYRGPPTRTTTTSRGTILTPEGREAAARADEMTPAIDAATRRAGEAEAATSDIRAGGFNSFADQLGTIVTEGRMREKEREQILAERFRQNDETISRLQNQAINPNRIFSAGDGSARIGAALAVTLGALGSAFTGQENFALELINREIDRDIEAQKEDLRRGLAGAEQSQNALTQLMGVHQDQRTAEAALREAQLGEIEGRIQSAIQTSTSAEMRAKLEALMLRVQQEREQARAMVGSSTIETSQVERSGGGGGPLYTPQQVEARRQNRYRMIGQPPTPEEVNANAAAARSAGGSNPAAGMAAPPGMGTSPEWESLSAEIKNRAYEVAGANADMIDRVDQLRVLYSTMGTAGVAVERNAYALAEQLTQDMHAIRSVATGQGGMTDPERVMRSRAFPNLSDFTSNPAATVENVTRWIMNNPSEVPRLLDATRQSLITTRARMRNRYHTPMLSAPVDPLNEGRTRNRE